MAQNMPRKYMFQQNLHEVKISRKYKQYHNNYNNCKQNISGVDFYLQRVKLHLGISCHWKAKYSLSTNKELELIISVPFPLLLFRYLAENVVF